MPELAFHPFGLGWWMLVLMGFVITALVVVLVTRNMKGASGNAPNEEPREL